MTWADAVLAGVVVLLMVNLLTALVTLGRHPASGTESSDWLLVILLAGTTGAAATAVLAVIADSQGVAGAQRFADVALVMTGTAALTAAVRAAALRRDDAQGPAPHPEGERSEDPRPSGQGDH